MVLNVKTNTLPTRIKKHLEVSGWNRNEILFLGEVEMKKFILILISLLILFGCSQSAEQQQQKAQTRADVGFPVKIGLQSEQGLPVQLMLDEQKPLPVELQVTDTEKLPVDITASKSLPVEVRWQSNESQPVEVKIAEGGELSVRLDMEGEKPLSVNFEMPQIPQKLINAAALMMICLLVTALASLLAAIFACRAAWYNKQAVKK
jgi:hypothetical protein